MSADNGIYILKTKDGQYRVIHAMAIENLWWSGLEEKSKKEMVPTEILRYFGRSKYTRDYSLALRIAHSIARREPILEYGVSDFYCNKTWRQIVEEGKQLAKLEIQKIKDDGREEREKWRLDILKTILEI